MGLVFFPGWGPTQLFTHSIDKMMPLVGYFHDVNEKHLQGERADSLGQPQSLLGLSLVRSTGPHPHLGC